MAFLFIYPHLRLQELEKMRLLMLVPQRGAIPFRQLLYCVPRPILKHCVASDALIILSFHFFLPNRGIFCMTCLDECSLDWGNVSRDSSDIPELGAHLGLDNLDHFPSGRLAELSVLLQGTFVRIAHYMHLNRA